MKQSNIKSPSSIPLCFRFMSPVPVPVPKIAWQIREEKINRVIQEGKYYMQGRLAGDIDAGNCSST
jgi:hypothetical protein